jgi:hypothetical protein
LGVNPSLTFGAESAYPVTLTIPVAVGLGFDGFYKDRSGNDETFGFFRIGASAGIPLTFMNEAGYGTWSATGGVTYWAYGDGVKDFNEDGAGGDDDGIVVATLGAQCNF